jgi:hypothetical protein
MPTADHSSRTARCVTLEKQEARSPITKVRSYKNCSRQISVQCLRAHLKMNLERLLMIQTSKLLSLPLTHICLFAVACRQPDASAPLPGTAVVHFGKRGRMLVYSAGDIVSDYLTAKR